MQQRVVLSQFIRRWKNKELVKLFTAWRNNVSVILRQRHVLAKFIKQWQNKNTLKIFRHWHEKAALSAYRRTNSGRMNRLSNAFGLRYKIQFPLSFHLNDRSKLPCYLIC